MPAAVEFMALKTFEDNEVIADGGDFREDATDDVRTNEEAYEELMQMQFRQNKYGKFGHNLDVAKGSAVFFNEDGSGSGESN